MKINFVIDSVSRNAGGVFDAERRLWQTLKKSGLNVSVFSLKDEFTEQDRRAWLPVAPESFPANWPNMLGRSTRLRSRLLAEPADLLYQAGLWKWFSRNTSEWSRHFYKPSIIAPHGMLDPWAVKNSGWKKRMALMLYERRNLEGAACIRALCESEAQSIRAFGLKNPICIIPNGIDRPEENQRPEVGSQKSDFWRTVFGKKVLLYLGRIHPKKGLVNLLHAWAEKQKSEEWVLAIAGWDQGGHEDELKRLATELRLAWTDVREQESEIGNRKSEILFLGPQFNEAKTTCYQNCDAFILPSFSEGLPMVILEAWAHGKPVLITPQCNLPEGYTANAAIRIATNVESIGQGLLQLFQTPNSELRIMGTNGHFLVATRFAWPKVAAEMKSVYEWMLGGGAKPDCVTLA